MRGRSYLIPFAFINTLCVWIRSSGCKLGKIWLHRCDKTLWDIYSLWLPVVCTVPTCHWDLCPRLGCLFLARWCQEILTSLAKGIGVEKWSFWRKWLNIHFERSLLQTTGGEGTRGREGKRRARDFFPAVTPIKVLGSPEVEVPSIQISMLSKSKSCSYK